MTQRQRQEQMAVAKPHPLKGIINSNDDPIACAICILPFKGRTDFVLSICCGKDICRACADQFKRGGSPAGCPVKCANSLQGANPKQRVAMIKKHAKMWEPWAQQSIGDAFDNGHGVPKSSADAIRWWEKASKKSHPTAAYNVGVKYLKGDGCRQNLEKALQHFQVALSSGMRFFVLKASAAIGQVAAEYMYANQGTHVGRIKAKSILLPLLDGDFVSPDVYWRLGTIYHLERMYKDAYDHYFQCAIAGEDEEAVHRVALNATICKDRLGALAQARFWAGRVKLADMYFSSAEDRKKALVDLLYYRRQFRELRDTCGGCGAEFEGKERKFCRACRTFCYCSRDCQKMHWNRKNDGHREDCKAAMELKKEMKEASRRRLMSSSSKGGC